jgi:hypothetical protein
MSSRPYFKPYTVIPNAQGSPAGSADMSANITSAPTVIQTLSMISYQIVWSGTSPVGAVSVQVSNSYSLNPDGSVQNTGSWDTIDFLYNGAVVSSVPVTGNSGSGFLDIDASGAYAMRLVYTATSGTGTMQAVVNAKVM